MPARYTVPFSDEFYPVAKINPASYTTEQVTAWCAMADYRRAVLVLHVGAIAAGRQVNCRIEQAQDAGGLGQKVVTTKVIDTLLDADDNALVAIEIRDEEMDAANDFDYICAKINPAGGAVILSAILYLYEPRYAPVPLTNWNQYLR